VREPRTEAPRPAGFTLIEVLVTLLIISGIMLTITQLLEAARVSRDTIHNVQETQLAGPAIMDLIERDLRGLALYDLDTDHVLRVKNHVKIGLDADSLDFLSTTDSLIPTEVDRRLVRADINEVGYRCRPNPKDDDFLEIYRREGFGADEEPFEGGAYTFLHDRLKHFDIQVFEEDGPEAEPLEDWDAERDQHGLPLRLEISMTLELQPRLTREQFKFASLDKRTITYKRVIRLPQSLVDQAEFDPVPAIPQILGLEELRQAQSTGGGGSEGAGGTGGGGTGGGAGGREGGGGGGGGGRASDRTPQTGSGGG
jgi:prepilin-type N-terminal cleavage/methylation domain-containing protein